MHHLHDLAKVLRLPRNLYLTLRKCCACHEIYTWPCESAAPATKSTLDLAKVLRLPRNLYLTLRKCYACHAVQTLQNLRAAVPMVRDRSRTVPGPFRERSGDRSGTVWRPFRHRSGTASVQASRPRWFAHCPQAQFTHRANVFCILPSRSSPDFSICRSFFRAHPCILKLSIC